MSPEMPVTPRDFQLVGMLAEVRSFVVGSTPFSAFNRSPTVEHLMVMGPRRERTPPRPPRQGYVSPYARFQTTAFSLVRVSAV